MTKLKLYIGAVIALAIIVQPLLVTNASASTVYDELIKTTDKVYVGDSNSKTDVTLNYAQHIQQSCSPDAYSSYTSALQSEVGRWAVVQTKWTNQTPEDYTVIVAWSENEEHETNFSESPSPRVWVSGRYVQLYKNGSSISCQYSSNVNSMTVLASSPAGQPKLSLLLSTYPVIYPIGYEGETIPRNHKIKYDYYVHFKVENQYNVNFSAKYTKVKTDPDYENPPKPQKVFWQIQDPDEISPNTGFPKTICSDYIDADKPFTERNCPNVQFEKKKYLFKSEATHVFEDEQNSPIELHFKTTTQKVDFNTIMKYDTEKCEPGALDVGEAVNCAAPSEYEECDLSDFGCHLRNFGVLLKHIFYDLFVPDFAVLEERFETLNTNLRAKLGFIWYPFDWLGLTFNSLTQSTASCHRGTIPSIPHSSNLGNGTLLGSNVNLNPCSLQNQLPVMYDVVVFMFRALTVFAMIIALNHKYRTFLGRGY